MRGYRIKREPKDAIFIWVMFAIFALYAVALIYPFLWCLLNSFKEAEEFFVNINGLPKQWVFTNWIESFQLNVKGVTIAQMYLNSIILTVGCTFIGMYSSSASAYIMTTYDFPCRSMIYTVAIVVMMIPTMGSMAAMYKLYNNIGLINTYLGILIISAGGFGTTFLLLYGYYKNLSWVYAEAAQIDGAGHFRIYFTIMLPMALPALTAVGILQAIGHWNDYFTIYMYAPEKVTIAYGIQLINAENSMDLPKVFASMMLSVLPVIAVFAAFQKTIMTNTSIGGVKG